MTSVDSPSSSSSPSDGGDAPAGSGRLDGPVTDAILRTGRFFRRGEASEDLRTVTHTGGRDADVFYRDRWSHDKVVRSTHGVNCTGSCSWKVYVKEGIITWEAQQTDYPDIGDDLPAYEPRGCPRGAAFSWYTYSPTRVRYPYVRGVLMQMWRTARAVHSDPVDAWASIVEDPVLSAHYKAARGKGGLVRCRWEDALEMAAAAHVYTAKTVGPDRVAGFSPIPAMSMASFGAGARFMQLFGGSMLSFYDWYADLPVASPQVFGDQTDVPESADWFNSTYLVMWGSNVPVTRTPDAHFMAEARYKGQKVVVVSPDYADNTKFADEWIHPHPGTDGALAMSMVHVVLTEFYARRDTPEFTSYAKTYTDLPFLVTLRTRADGTVVPDKFLTADAVRLDVDPGENAASKTVMLDAVTDRVVVPNGTLGDRFGEQGKGRWNLDLGEIDPVLSLHGSGGDTAEIVLPRFDTPRGEADTVTRGVPVRTVVLDDDDEVIVTTVFDLMMAQFGVARDGLPGDWPTGYDDPAPYTPAWQEEHTGVPAAQAERFGREFAQNALDSGGRSMILMGAGTNHWFHSDLIYRAFLSLTILTGCQGVNGGGWAHYVGQEKVRPLTGFQQVANALDWSRPPRQMISTAFFYLHTGQWKYDAYAADVLTSPTGDGRFDGMSTPDLVAMSARLGWMPSYPTFSRNPLDLGDEAAAAGVPAGEYVVDRIKAGDMRFAAEDPDGPGNAPRILTVWRSNLIGSSAKGDEYFLKHLLGTDSSLRADQAPEGHRGRDMVWREEGDSTPDGKLDLLMTLDFRMTSTTLFSDLVLPAATWYEKHDLSSTDMHPFVHSFNAAINPPWETRSDFDTFKMLAEKVSELSHGHLDARTDVVAVPLGHDTPDAMANPGGTVADWKDGSCEPVPGKNFPKIATVERDYRLIGEKFGSLGPLAESAGMPVKGLNLTPTEEIAALLRHNGETRTGVGKGRPRLDTDIRMCEAILSLSGTTNGRLATQGFEQLEERTGRELADLSRGEEGKRITFSDTQSRPQPVITSPEWSGSEHGGRRYSAFVINTERLKPWHTLTGRMQFFMDHDWMAEMGEQLPVYRPPLNMHELYGEPRLGHDGGAELTVRYLTPHNKWSIHSEYQDNLLMLSLGRGGPMVWMSDADAALIGVKDNDWIEAVNRNGVIVARAVVSHRMPAGTVYMHHAQDRTIDVPLSETDGKRGGIHNSATRIMVKPSHLIGGYAHFSYAWNYIGPTGNQRDEVTVIRRRSQEVQY